MFESHHNSAAAAYSPTEKISTPMALELALQVGSILTGNFGAKLKNGYYQSVQCLRCQRNNAFTSEKDPRQIKCNHSSCPGHAGISWSEYAPTAFAQSPSASVFNGDDPALARAYAVKRGIPNFEKWGGCYRQIHLGNGSFWTLCCIADNGSENHTIVNPLPGMESKSNSKGSNFSSAAWLPAIELDKNM